MRINTNNRESITLRNIPLQEVDVLFYLGSVITGEWDTEKDVKTRIQKAREDFITLKNIWS
jgi:hypothetical protein